jgi:hypothetical protein
MTRQVGSPYPPAAFLDRFGYNIHMRYEHFLSIEAAIWNGIDIDQPFSAAAARALLRVNFAAKDQERMRQLAAKARAGALNANEEREIDAYERLACLLDILHSKARQALKNKKTA